MTLTNSLVSDILNKDRQLIVCWLSYAIHLAQGIDWNHGEKTPRVVNVGVGVCHCHRPCLLSGRLANRLISTNNKIPTCTNHITISVGFYHENCSTWFLAPYYNPGWWRRSYSLPPGRCRGPTQGWQRRILVTFNNIYNLFRCHSSYPCQSVGQSFIVSDWR